MQEVNVAEIVPIRKDKPVWKREIARLSIAGTLVSSELLQDREEEA